MDITSSRAMLRRAELASRLGCNLETIRYYEKIGLLPEPARSPSGHRLYSNVDQLRLRFILRARDLGFRTEDVRSLLGINDGMPSCAEVMVLAEAHLKDIRNRILDLQQMERQLSEIMIGCTGGQTSDCALTDKLFESR
ncbi:MerR family transcriptional regulator [Hyphomonas sp. NPDC076900]|jgi:MerR family mercuric resistance operon transcriptional regulator|nr:MULTISPECIES: helix-turn-helix domain-containing protein [Hyphomonas]MCB9960822.1 helix-turn-helix domain-containing protein [Hyphomonas sp.]OYW84502.1 MAG: transcriptional regulator [Hyphomonas sp. 32-62-5]PKP81721.1 MAG: transcriptional regulator [Alphaproteobacteria bacterium HGW-Alphaproteobacteria-18]AXE64128.1 transcriptional regulator [Hyphomonas sp. CACIAM 19H1]KCZ92523.1 mercuric resistance operon regulatory protein [Hyphomonas hirschiana VP5]